MHTASKIQIYFHGNLLSLYIFIKFISPKITEHSKIPECSVQRLYYKNNMQPCFLKYSALSSKSCLETPMYAERQSIHIYSLAPRFIIFLWSATSRFCNFFPHFMQISLLLGGIAAAFGLAQNPLI